MTNKLKINKIIRIITFHSAYSFGAVLQSFALWKFLEEKFTDVKIINFRPELFSLNFNWKNPISWPKYFSFSFAKKIGLTREYSANEIRINPPKADTYIIGSDQVWNPRITQCYQDIYFGHFIPATSKKISYASSFGQDHFNSEEMDKISYYIHGFDSISVRENSGIDLIRSLTGTDAIHVLDPTFLIEDYTKYFNLGRIKNELCLFVLDNESIECFKYTKKISDSLNLRPKVLNKRKPVAGFRCIAFPTIPRFLKEIYQSKFVITNSFHGLAFSIIFKKNFLFIGTNKRNLTRPLSLLESLGLENRLFNTYKEAFESNLYHENINYDKVGITLSNLSALSTDYLLSNI